LYTRHQPRNLTAEHAVDDPQHNNAHANHIGK
jgi:hypothetical protein